MKISKNDIEQAFNRACDEGEDFEGEVDMWAIARHLGHPDMNLDALATFVENGGRFIVRRDTAQDSISIRRI